jgi:arginase
MNFVHAGQRPVTIISFPSNLGLIEPAPSKEPGVKKLPAILKNAGFFDLFSSREEITLQPPPYSMHLDPITNMRNADAIASYALQQASIIGDTVSGKNFALVIGGDCSILIGNALALRKLGRYKLFFIDGHTDFMWPSLSSTHGVAGMDLAIVTGHGHANLSNLEGLAPYFNEEDTWCVGNREYDPEYVAAIENTSIHYYDLDMMRNQGIDSCLQEFFAELDAGPTDGFWIHLDVDVLDPLIMPAVDSPDPGGINYAELNRMLTSLLSHPICVGMEITILDPDRDPSGKIIQNFIQEVGVTIQQCLKTDSSAQEFSPNPPDFATVLVSSICSHDIKPEYDMYARLLGNWRLKMIDYDSNNLTTRHRTGIWYFSRTLEGRAIQDVLVSPEFGERPDGSALTGNRYGNTFRMFDPKTNQWKIDWFNPVSGAHNQLVARTENDKIIQENVESGGLMMRWIFENITAESFHWYGEESSDKGKTWVLSAEFFASRIK